jgi:hypothetical protein
MSFALQVAGCGENIRLQTRWDDPAPMDEREFLQNIILKKQLGITTEQALLEAGYGRADITQMLGTPNKQKPDMQKPARSKGEDATTLQKPLQTDMRKPARKQGRRRNKPPQTEMRNMRKPARKQGRNQQRRQNRSP